MLPATRNTGALTPRPLLYGPSGLPIRADTAHHGASYQDPALASWQPFAGSADADLLPDLETLRSRSRDLARNHGLASAAVQNLVDNVIGVGLRLQATPDYRALGWERQKAQDWARNTEAQFRSWAEGTECDAACTLNLQGLATLIFRQQLINGEGLALPMWRPNRPGFRWATCLSLVEADRLSNPQDKLDNQRLRGGIEIDRFGAPKAYHIRKSHPGDVFLGAPVAANWKWLRIPARTPWGRLRVIHLHNKERSGQSRGKPFFSSVIGLFKMLDHYQRTELQAAVVNAMVAAFIETAMSQEQVEDMFGAAEDPKEFMDQRNASLVPLQGGAIMPLQPGEKMSAFTPTRPTANYSHYMESLQRTIGAGLHMSYEQLLRDYSRTNYSSARAAMLQDWRTFMGRRSHMANYFYQPTYTLWLEEAVNAGAIDAPGFYSNQAAYSRATWIGPGRGWIDPVKEPAGSKIKMEAGLTTHQAECLEQGLDWEEVFEQQAVEKARREELGLPPVAPVQVQLHINDGAESNNKGEKKADEQ